MGQYFLMPHDSADINLGDNRAVVLYNDLS